MEILQRNAKSEVFQDLREMIFTPFTYYMKMCKFVSGAS